MRVVGYSVADLPTSCSMTVEAVKTPDPGGEGEAFFNVMSVLTDNVFPFEGWGCSSSSSFQSNIDAALFVCLPSDVKIVDDDSELRRRSVCLSMGGLPLPRPLPRPLPLGVCTVAEGLRVVLSAVPTGDFISTSDASDSLCRWAEDAPRAPRPLPPLPLPFPLEFEPETGLIGVFAWVVVVVVIASPSCDFVLMLLSC